MPQGEVGEIVVRGHNVMKGYWNKPDATAEAIRDGWFHTGDMARIDEDGYFFIVDRKKDMIIRGGYNVYPREIEEVLYEHPAVREAAVIGVPHDELGEEVGAAVALKDGEDVERRRAARVRQGAGRRLQVPAQDLVRRRAAQGSDRQDPQARDRTTRGRLTATLAIRDAEPRDVPLIYSLIVELAEYERAPEKVTGTEAMLAESLFGARPWAEAVIAEQLDAAGTGRTGEAGDRAAGGLAGEPIGFALFHSTYSTWECRPGIWLEDLYVPPQQRRGGVGGALLAHLARITVERGCARLEWAALDWNTPALDFYAKLGAEVLSEWTMHRLEGDALARVADGVTAG